MTKTAPELDTASAVLDAVRSDRAVADAAEARILQAAVQWAAMHSTDSIEEAAADWFGDQPIPVAGPGAALVAEFSIAELASALGLPTEVGKAYVGEALELRHRLPRTWARVAAGDLAAWRARRIARSTIALSREAAAYVDAKIASFAHKIRPTALDRVIEAAIARFMPEEAGAQRQSSADARRFDIDTRQTGLNGTATVYGTLDLADALDLEAAVADVAGQLKDLGSQDTLDVRRSVALGEIARRQLTLDLETGSTASGPGSGRAGRDTTLYVHLAEEALSGAGGVGRLANLNLPVLEQQIRSWCGASTKLVVKPVIDLEACAPVDSYDVPDRMAEQVDLRDRHCVFPWCSRPARRCDHDHVIPHPDGPTCACNLAPLCRRHHRLKTHGRWRYVVLDPGTYLWTSPHRYQYLVDHQGTLDVSRDRAARPSAPDE